MPGGTVLAIPTVKNPNVINLHVSTNYVKPWGKWHAIREFFQNLYDACLHIVHNNPAHLFVDERDTENLFVFADKSNPNDIASIGMVYYQADTQTLIISNELRGDMKMSTRCLLLGGSDSDKHNKTADSPIAGEFGEGFKLAVLALLRLGCSVNIVVGKDKWKFFLREDPVFENETCLWVEILKNVEASTKVQVTIEGISQGEFAMARRRLLLITDRDPHRILPSTAKGVILFDEEYKSHIYVRGIYVSEKPCGWPQCFGYDALELKLDRDRMAFQEPDVFIAHTSQIVGETLVHYMRDPGNIGAVGTAKNLVRRLYPAVKWSDQGVLHQHINVAVANLFWEKFAEFHPNCQPMSVYQPNDEQGRPEYSIAIKFPHLYLSVDYYLLQILRKSASFKSPLTWLSEAILRAREEYPAEDRQQIESAIQVVGGMPNLEIGNIVILKNEGQHNYISCVQNKCLYIPKQQVDTEITLLGPMGPTPTPLSRALLMLANRCKNSDYCVQL